MSSMQGLDAEKTPRNAITDICPQSTHIRIVAYMSIITKLISSFDLDLSIKSKI